MPDFEKVDLTNCDREPIHVPGSIQPYGCLVACDVAAHAITRHSRNCNEMLGIEGNLNGLVLADVVGSEVAHEIRNALARLQGGSRSGLLFGQKLPNGRCFDIAVHEYRGAAIIEFEPGEKALGVPLSLARTMIGRIAVVQDVDQLLRDTARLMRVMLGYDRVMVYQFGADGAGKVVSEHKRHDLESFLGQYFPSGDIPQQARALYLQNTIRIICDANFEPVPIEPVLDASGEPLDLSFAHLRSVSPVHCEYLRNMGVGASMSISIVVDGALWGLIACHHYGPRTLTMAQRVAAEMFGQFFSLQLAAVHHEQSLEVATRARAALDRFLRDSARAGDINGALRKHLADFADLIPCDGASLWLDGEWSRVGPTPDAAAMDVLVRFAETVAEGRVWATHKLADALPAARSWADVASGVLIIPVSQRPRDFLFFFRKEVVQTLDWAGNPEKNYGVGPLGDRLTPRTSFAIWKETVKQQATPWSEGERRFAEAARLALVEVVLQHTELLADERARAEVRQRMLNEELNHRVKNILAVIKSLVSQPTESGQSLENYVNSLRGRIQALSLAHDQVIRGEGGGSLRQLLQAELTPYSSNAVKLDGPQVWLDARAYSILALVLHELATNAAKYGALSNRPGTLSVSWQLDAVGACDLHWVEAGGPEVSAPVRKGFGTILIDRSVPFDLGGESDIEYRRDGVRARFRIPSRFVMIRKGGETPGEEAKPEAPRQARLSGRSVLIVEDQLLIAMNLEQILEDAGMTVAATTTTVDEALRYLKTGAPDYAVLDVNLGEGTSEPIAERLDELGVPFMFATGYGDGGAIPERFRHVAIVRKPYDAASIEAEMGRL